MSDTLRERIAEACCLAENGPSWSWVPDNGAGDQDVYYAMADAVLSVLHEAGEDAGLREPMGNDGLADRVVESMAGQGWRLQRTVLASPAVAGEQEGRYEYRIVEEPCGEPLPDGGQRFTSYFERRLVGPWLRAESRSPVVALVAPLFDPVEEYNQ